MRHRARYSLLDQRTNGDILEIQVDPGKVKLSLCLTKHHAMKTLGSVGIVTRILDLVTGWR